MNKVQLHFTWDNGIDASPSIYLINVDLLRADNLGGNTNAIRNELLNYIDSDTKFMESDLMNRISRSEDDDDGGFDIYKYVVEAEIKTITIRSWVEF